MILKNYLNGEFVDSESRFPNINPVNGQLIAEVAVAAIRCYYVDEDWEGCEAEENGRRAPHRPLLRSFASGAIWSWVCGHGRVLVSASHR